MSKLTQFKNEFGTFKLGDIVVYQSTLIGELTKIYNAKDKELMSCDVSVRYCYEHDEITEVPEYIHTCDCSAISKVDKFTDNLQQSLATQKQTILNNENILSQIKRGGMQVGDIFEHNCKRYVVMETGKCDGYDNYITAVTGGTQEVTFYGEHNRKVIDHVNLTEFDIQKMKVDIAKAVMLDYLQEYRQAQETVEQQRRYYYEKLNIYKEEKNKLKQLKEN